MNEKRRPQGRDNGSCRDNGPRRADRFAERTVVEEVEGIVDESPFQTFKAAEEEARRRWFFCLCLEYILQNSSEEWNRKNIWLLPEGFKNCLKR